MVSLSNQNKFEETIIVINNLIEDGYNKKDLTDFFEEKDEDGFNALDKLVTSSEYIKWKEDN